MKEKEQIMTDNKGTKKDLYVSGETTKYILILCIAKRRAKTLD